MEESAVPLRGLFPGGRRIVFSRDGNSVIAPHTEKSTRGVFYLGVWDAESGKEVGVRKALGAYRLPLLIQSMSESVILCAVSLALGLCHILGSL
jgi:hypothetical protein